MTDCPGAMLTVSLMFPANGPGVHVEPPVPAHVVEQVRAAEAKGVITQVGYNYIKNPLLKLARQMIETGELGDISGFRGIHAEDYMADAEGSYTWRLDPVGGPGVVADLGSHIIAMARFLLGPISEVNADLQTVVKSRPVAPGSAERRPVLVDDVARLIVRFAKGFGGTLEASWVSTGRKMQLGFELTGSKGSLVESAWIRRFGANRKTRAPNGALLRVGAEVDVGHW